MRCSHCGICCENTEMLLSEEDMRLLERAGYKKEEFTRYDKRGFAKLRNSEGYCVFYDMEAHRCKIYRHRPAGCRIYPVIYDEERGVICDELCPLCDTVTETEVDRKTARLSRLLQVLDREARRRIRPR